jgi:hypothetical protein
MEPRAESALGVRLDGERALVSFQIRRPGGGAASAPRRWIATGVTARSRSRRPRESSKRSDI